ncbi:MAG: hypothetical protein ABI317_16160 [Gaiellales bacterium]
MSDLRRFVLPIACGSIAEGLLILLLAKAGGAAAPAALLFVLEAAILGWVFGPEAGTLGATAPVLVFGIVVLATDSSGDRGSDVAVIVFVLVLLGFTAWFVAALRRRYGNPGPRG